MRKIHFETIDSTNTYAKSLPSGEALLITADEQTGGRGRHGRSFSSVKNNGLYMTYRMPVGKKAEEALFITILTAVAVYDVLSRYADGLSIKWVNDIYHGDRKVCGILCEAVTDFKTGIMTDCIIGIGINLNADISLMPEELKGKAGALLIDKPKDELADEIVAEIDRLMTLPFNEVLNVYREHQYLMG
ncbi:MAG: biotin--[acetyl-CoA-carboxylase] ligase, partial [Eubacteriales bacterium]|nr:biotin--[acetyl-CoA-carboxylase] ligase [Eubacteriales bacterium]